MAADLIAKRRSRGYIKGRITHFKSTLDALAPNDDVILSQTVINEIQTRLDSAIPTLESFYSIHDSICALLETDDLVAVEEEKREEFEVLYFSTVARAKTLLDTHASRASTPTHNLNNENPQRNSIRQNIQLPKINLPTFSGERGAWLEFRDKFVSLIHSDPSMDNIEKHHYLRSCLSGDASMVIQGVEYSAEHYDEAWRLLCTRYNNVRVLMHNHIRALFQIENTGKESSHKLLSLSDNVSKHLNALNQLKNQNTNLFDVLMIYLISSKFDFFTARAWEESISDVTDDALNLDLLQSFIRNRANVLTTIEMKRSGDKSTYVNKTQSYKQNNINVNIPKINSFVTNTLKCVLCKSDHILRNCPDFIKMSIDSRLAKIKLLRRCTNCLRYGHPSTTCDASSCQKCGKRHHTLLHIESNANAHTATEISVTPTPTPESGISAVAHNCSGVLLSTALVYVYDNHNNRIVARVLLDSGSQPNLMTYSLAKKLNLQLSPIELKLHGVIHSHSTIKHSCMVKLNAMHSNFSLETTFHVASRVTGLVPSVILNRNALHIPANITLADSSFDTPDHIDMLIGAEHFYSLLSVGQIKLGPRGLVLQKTMFGWILSGMAAGSQISKSPEVSCNLAQTSFDEFIGLEKQLQKFWEVEEIPFSNPLSHEEHYCEQHFKNTTTRNSVGRFVVSIPTQNLAELGNTREIALKRFYNVERSLQRNPVMKAQYVAFMTEYLALGHMSPSTSSDNSQPIYYLPHHSVKNESSTTTKLRVVFDGSAKPISGKSLNECQMVGPCIQDDLFAILLRFRNHTFAFSADIAKMYRQILISPEQRSLQRIFWRSSPQELLETYDLSTVTYGTASASYLAIRCLFQIAEDIESTHPEAAHCIRHDFYVDDLLSGADTIEDAQKLARTILLACNDACFPLRKWTSNCPEILDGLNECVSNSVDFGDRNDASSKTLGLLWRAKDDILHYRIALFPSNHTSKRIILSTISQVFDPLGLLSPCTITGKILMQRLWQARVNWDESVPLDVYTDWKNYCNSLIKLRLVSIPRNACCPNAVKIDMHGFSDASSKAYGACLYMRCTDQTGHVSSRILCAKTKVAPLQVLSIPRLELCGALLLSRLFKKSCDSLNINLSETYLWTDSMVVLSWLRLCPSRLRTFVANRVAKIQNLTNVSQWRHVPTDDNPADIITRGLGTANLQTLSLWWQGPTWLELAPLHWPNSTQFDPTDSSEMRPVSAICSVLTYSSIVNIENYSSLSTLKRITAYILRFIHNLRRKNAETRRKNSLSTEELESAFLVLIRIEQRFAFSNEILALKNKTNIASTSSILSLAPFLDDQGILRVGGRLKNAALPLPQTHPILIPRSNHLATLICVHEHHRLLHAGPLGTLYAVRQNYWPISGRTLARRVVRECLTCFRANPSSHIIRPTMGQLPESRVTPMPPFFHCGVDYAGPFVLKTMRGRGCKTYKGYLALFVCMCTKALHLELVTSLSTEAFLSALRRLIARRGVPQIIYSDNGTNFVGAARELRDLGNFLQSNSENISNAAAKTGIQWRFIPARSPHFGGLWEAGVKSVKHHLRRVIADQPLTYEDLYTLIVRIEAILNSRPLTSLSPDPNDISCITPAHFLIGRPLTSLPDDKNYDTDTTHFLRYQHMGFLAQQFWKQWSRTYLNELQQRSKWKQTGATRRNLTLGDLVLLVDDTVPPYNWRLGRIQTLHPGSDGVTRVVSVKTTTGIVKRAVQRICPLPQQ